MSLDENILDMHQRRLSIQMTLATNAGLRLWERRIIVYNLLQFFTRRLDREIVHRGMLPLTAPEGPQLACKVVAALAR
jgi:hypothetical protein